MLRMRFHAQGRIVAKPAQGARVVHAAEASGADGGHVAEFYRLTSLDGTVLREWIVRTPGDCWEFPGTERGHIQAMRAWRRANAELDDVGDVTSRRPCRHCTEDTSYRDAGRGERWVHTASGEAECAGRRGTNCNIPVSGFGDLPRT